MWLYVSALFWWVRRMLFWAISNQAGMNIIRYRKYLPLSISLPSVCHPEWWRVSRRLTLWMDKTYFEVWSFSDLLTHKWDFPLMYRHCILQEWSTSANPQSQLKNWFSAVFFAPFRRAGLLAPKLINFADISHGSSTAPPLLGNCGNYFFTVTSVRVWQLSYVL